MEKEQFDEIKQFARRLTEKRLLMPDGQLLDLCQQHLDALVLHIEDEFEEHPHINDEAAAPEPEPEPEPPFTPSAPEHEPEEIHRPHIVPHKAPHKRPAPRKTHR